jgi:hypothetical protein
MWDLTWIYSQAHLLMVLLFQIMACELIVPQRRWCFVLVVRMVVSWPILVEALVSSKMLYAWDCSRYFLDRLRF